MITNCPHCGRLVPLDEYITKTTRYGYVPVMCCNGDGPYPGAGETVRNHPYWYVSVVDDDNPKRKGFLLGPYGSYEEAESFLPLGKKLAGDADYKAAWYGYGIASSVDPIKTVFGMGVQDEAVTTRKAGPKGLRKQHTKSKEVPLG